MSDIRLYTEITSLPPDIKKEVEEFIAFLKSKAKRQGSNKKRTFGACKGFFKMSDDFDEPLEDFKKH
jgi:hypothetical protein